MTEELKQLREALRRVKYEAASLADAQVIALEALTAAQPAQTEREAFEAFAAKNEFGSYLIERKGDGYWSSHTQLMWMAWQARASLPTQPAQAERIAELEADYQRLMDKHNALHINALKDRTERDTLRAEVERLRVDSERLDWLLWRLPGDAIRSCVGELADTADGIEFRAAIDTARKEAT